MFLFFLLSFLLFFFFTLLTVILSLAVCLSVCLFHFRSFVRSSGQNDFFSICSSLNVPTVNNIIQCVSADGQIGFVSNTDVEPLHIVSIAKPILNSNSSTYSTMSNFFQRKGGKIRRCCFFLLLFEYSFRFWLFSCLLYNHLDNNKKTLLKTKGKQLSKDMIGLPQADFIHAFHIGVSGS